MLLHITTQFYKLKISKITSRAAISDLDHPQGAINYVLKLIFPLFSYSAPYILHQAVQLGTEFPKEISVRHQSFPGDYQVIIESTPRIVLKNVLLYIITILYICDIFNMLNTSFY